MQTEVAPGGYIRGGEGVVDTRRLFQVLLALAIATLAAFVVVLAIAAAHQNSRTHTLQRRGVPVDVTVTSCLGILSGTGITVTSFQCTGSFELAGRSYNAVIAGSSANHAAGDVVKAIADPKHPTSVATPSSLANVHSSWRAFIAPAVLFLVLVLLIAATVWWSRRRAAQRRRDGAALDATHPTSVPATGLLANGESSSNSIAPYVASLALALVLLIAGALWALRRNSAQRPSGEDALG